jgi:hypothetical protein
VIASCYDGMDRCAGRGVGDGCVHVQLLMMVLCLSADRPRRPGDAGELDSEGACEGGQALRRHGGGDRRQQEVLLRVSTSRSQSQQQGASLA